MKTDVSLDVLWIVKHTRIQFVFDVRQFAVWPL